MLIWHEMELLSWNVNGLRACMTKGFIEWVKAHQPDILCVQETKARPDQVSLSFELPNYRVFWNSAKKKGYSGVLTLVKTPYKPSSVKKTMVDGKWDKEGRFLQLEFDQFYLLNFYFPNAQRELKRLDFKLEFNDAVLAYCETLRKKKHLILCGDFNVAHKEIDLKNPKTNQKNAGFSPPEREWFSSLLAHGYMDTFREFNQSSDQYTWWSYRANARPRNIGWRIDYFVINQEFRSFLLSAFILQDIMGSDHAPVGIKINNLK
ncbi:MAG: exodeoxyribonuclease III [Candidatus Thorarchaeota archaeon]